MVEERLRVVPVGAFPFVEQNSSKVFGLSVAQLPFSYHDSSAE
jgi:hypothetical protein